MAEINPTVLKNKGAPVKLYSVEPYVREKSVPTIGADGQMTTEIVRSIGWRPQTRPDNGEPVVLTEWVRMDANVMSEMEIYFGSMEKFQKASEERQADAVRLVLTSMLGGEMADPDDVQKVGARMIADEAMNYQNAVMVCLSMANGVDPTKAAALLEEGRLAVRRQSEAANEAMDEALKEMEEERLKLEAEAVEDGDEIAPAATSPAEASIGLFQPDASSSVVPEKVEASEQLDD